MDEADTAQITEQHNLDAARRRRHATLPAIGKCYSCGADADEGRKFCDRECLEDFERIEAARMEYEMTNHREVMQQAMEALEKGLESLVSGVTFNMTQAAIEALRAALAKAKHNDWKDAVIEKLAVSWAITAENENDPVKAVNDLIASEVQIALDPVVSSDAQALIERGRREALAEAEKVEPVAWMDREGDIYPMPERKGWAPPHTMLYARPPVTPQDAEPT